MASIITKSDIALIEWKGAQAGDQAVCGAQSFGAGKFNNNGRLLQLCRRLFPLTSSITADGTPPVLGTLFRNWIRSSHQSD